MFYKHSSIKIQCGLQFSLKTWVSHLSVIGALTVHTK